MRFTILNYWNAEGTHAPYQNMLHDESGEEKLQLPSELEPLLNAAGVRSGDEIEISITRTGRRPFAGRHMRLTRPNHYEFVEGNDPK